MLGFFRNLKSLDESGLLPNSVDNHSHVLFGVDDGVKTAEESLNILDFMEEAGVRKLILTPHVMEDVPNTTEGLRSRFEELKNLYTGRIELHLAAEYMIDTLFSERLRNGDLLTVAENKVLVETSTWSPPIDLWDILDMMIFKGYHPILAHPERYRYMTDHDYRKLRSMGVIMQLNIPSVLGIYGDDVKKKANRLLSDDMYAITGSDCHRYRAITGQYAAKCLNSDTISKMKPLMNGLD